MKNKLVFTQDIPGEREWLQSNFPGYENLETKHSGKWPSESPDKIPEAKCLLEIPASDTIDIHANFHADTYVSLFNKTYPQTKWVFADTLITDEKFSDFSDVGHAHYQGITFARVGTVFVESLLDRSLVKLSNHVSVVNHDSNQKIIDLIKQSPGTYVTMTYRSNWWAWVTSMAISKQHGFFHYNSPFDWHTANSISISEQDLLGYEQQVLACWNFFFQVRTSCPNHSFYLLEFSDILAKYQKDTNHLAMPYDKRKLISNYDQIEKVFNENFLSRWQQWEQRAVRHLKNMKCRADIDNLF